MTRKRKRPPPIYRKPDPLPASAENLKAWAKQSGEPDPMGRLLKEWGDALRAFLAGEGVPILKRLPRPDAMQPGETWASVDGGFLRYRKAEAMPAAIEAIEALQKVEEVRRETGERRALAAFYLGAAIERLRATGAWAGAIHAYHASRAKPHVPDEQIRAALAKYPKLADAAAAVGLSERQFRTRRNRLKPEV